MVLRAVAAGNFFSPEVGREDVGWWWVAIKKMSAKKQNNIHFSAILIISNCVYRNRAARDGCQFFIDIDVHLFA